MPEAVFQQRQSRGECRWLCCEDLQGVIQASRPAEVLPALEAVQRASQQGLYAAGYIAYEAAAGLDPYFATHSCPAMPLVWFGLFGRMATREQPTFAPSASYSVGPWKMDVSQSRYRSAIERIKAYIAAGDTYQVNYTLRQRASFQGEPWPFFVQLCHAQQADYCAYLDTGHHVICSASPELFFRLSDGVITCRPMKGTAPRGSTAQEDRVLARSLAESAKNRAENAMIVDMMRNDLGRIADVGSVQVADVFRIESYPTLFQMTSTVTARTKATFVPIIQALFPCASITGAPKIRTMQIIRELEGSPRGVYTGCIGYVAPGGVAQFNVAIRTVAIRREDALAEYGVGGGIVWDSRSDEEYEECVTKAAVLTRV